MNAFSKILMLAMFTSFAVSLSAGTISIDFDDTGLAPDSYRNGSDGYGAFFSRNARVDNNYDFTFGSWDGFALSTVNDTTTPGYGNQFAVWGNGKDVSGQGAYAVGYYSEFMVEYMGALPPTLTLPFDCTVRGLHLNNTTYAALSILHGDGFAKKFGGASGNDPDWLKLTIIGHDATGASVGTVDFYLADYRGNSAEDYIVSDWTWVDLTSLGRRVRSLSFVISSSDVGDWGMNTPAYFALDDIKVIPTVAQVCANLDGLRLMGEADAWKGDGVLNGFSDLEAIFGTTFIDWGGGFSSWSGFCLSRVNDTNTQDFANEAAVWGDGKDRSGDGNYAVFYDGGFFAGPNDGITFARPVLVKGFYVNNTTYAALAMLNGDVFAKKFGGANGTDPDWFKLTITGYNTTSNVAGTVEFYLADYRFADSKDDYVVSDWTWVDLTTLGPGITRLNFAISSSDTGEWGINTPTYFALDDLCYIESFSGAAGDTNVFRDSGIPGFIGNDGLGISDGDENIINPLFAAWASGVATYAPAPNVAINWQDTNKALGPVTGNNFDIVSLGDLNATQISNGVAPGTITLTFDAPITDKEGPDFAVFENGYISWGTGYLFAELGYVEVSSDGINFARFPAAALSTNIYGGQAYGSIDTRFVNNLCGLHVNAYGHSWGTPFDLSDLSAHPLVLDGTVSLTNITHVKIVDIPGNGSFYDSCVPPNPIVDAWPTWGSGGVDLEAIGVINSSGAARIDITIVGDGTVSPLGYPVSAVSVTHGQDKEFNFEPGNNSIVLDVFIDGTSMGATNSWNFINLQSDHTIKVVFGPQPAVTVHGVPIAWLDAMGLTGESDEGRALADQDNDGFAAWQEYYAGTNPLDPDSKFAVVEFTQGGNSISMTWLGGTSGSPLPFEILAAPTLTGTWSVVAENISKHVSGTNIWNGIPAAEQRFFRVRVQGLE